MALLFRRLNEALDRNTLAFDRNTLAFERNERAFERSERAFERSERAFEDLQAVIRENRLLQQRSLEHLEAFMERINGDAEARMAAVRKMLDRWGEGPTPAS